MDDVDKRIFALESEIIRLVKRIENLESRLGCLEREHTL